MASEYGALINENVLKIYGSYYEPLPQAEEEVDAAVVESKSDALLEEMKMRLQSRVLQGSNDVVEDDEDNEVVDENVVDYSPVDLNDFKQSITTTETSVEEVEEVETVVEPTAIIEADHSADELTTKERIMARIEEKRKLKELEASN